MVSINHLIEWLRNEIDLLTEEIGASKTESETIYLNGRLAQTENILRMLLDK